MKDTLENIARRNIPQHIDLWPRIAAQLTERKSFVATLRARPMLAVLIVLLVVLLLTGAAYAIGLLTGYIPGIGFVQTNSLRVLAEPVSQTRDGATVSIEQVTVDPERTVIVYKTEGLTIAAANSKGEGGPFGAPASLRLPDGTTLAETIDLGYAGTPEPVINNIHTEGGWPNYVWRLVYPPVPRQANDLTLLIPILQTMPLGSAPENWEITFHLKPAPPDMTFAPITELASASTPLKPPSSAAGTSSSSGTSTPAPSNSATRNGFTFKLENVIELDDGFVVTGDLAWDDSAFPTGKGSLAEEVVPTLTDQSGQQIPIERVQLNSPYGDHHAPWSYRTNRKAFSGPMTLSIQSIKTSMTAPDIDFELNFGSNLQIGQSWDINRDFTVEGHTVHLLSVSLRNNTADSCTKAAVEFKFKGDTADMGAMVTDANPESPPTDQVCTGGGGGGGGPVDPTIFYGLVTYYRGVPTGLHHYSIGLSVPYEVKGPWQVVWNPPVTTQPTPTAEAAACLTREKWQQLISRDDPLPAGVAGHIVTTVNEGGLLPAIYVSSLDGTISSKVATAGWPSLSPDGTRLAYSASDGLHILDLSSGHDLSLGTDGYHILWSPDGTRILYTTTFSLYVVNADGTGLQKVNISAGQVIALVGWLSDNQTIVYSVMGGEGFNLKTYYLPDGATQDLFTVHNKAGYAALSPDGEWIVFADRVFGADNWGIYIARPDGSERKLVAAPEVPTAFTSLWGPNGQWLMLNTQGSDGTPIPVLVNPFTCQAVHLKHVTGMVEDWSR